MKFTAYFGCLQVILSFVFRIQIEIELNITNQNTLSCFDYKLFICKLAKPKTELQYEHDWNLS